MAGMLKGKVAMITGASSGIGRAAGMVFAREGAKVVLAARRAEAGQKVVEEIKTAGGTAVFVRADVSRAEEVKALVEKTVSQYGRLDCAVNNAAVTPDTHPIADFDEAEFDRVLAVDLKGVALCLKYEIAQMLSQGDGGAVVNIGSVSSFRPQPNNAAYVAAKHGVIGLTKTAALEYADAKIRVNAVCPGFIQTQMTEDTMRRRGEAILGQVPFRRMGNPEEIAEMVVWLCSERASYVSGAAYNVDGGWMAM